MARILGTIASSSFEDLGDFESIATVSVGSGGAANVEFTSIPQTYTHLQVRASWGFSNTTNNTWLETTFNSDTGSNYSWHYLRGNGSSAFAAGEPNYNFLSLGADDQGDANIWAVSVADILDYSNTNKYKTTRSLAGQDRNGAGGIGFWSGSWRSTSAITSIKIDANGAHTFRQYSHFALYGIRSA